MAGAERLPSRRARLPAAPPRVVVPRRAPAVAVRILRRLGDRDQGACRARGRGDGRLVRGPLPAAAPGCRDRRRGRRSGAPRGLRDRAALRRGRLVRVREPLRGSVARHPRHLLPRRAAAAARAASTRRPDRAPGGRARAGPEPALEHGRADLCEDALRRDGDPRLAGEHGVRRRAVRRPDRLRGSGRSGGGRRRARTARTSRARRGRPRCRSTARRRGDSGGRCGQRDERARSPPLHPEAHLQLPRPARGAMGRRRYDEAHLSRQPAGRPRAGTSGRAPTRSRVEARLRRGRRARLQARGIVCGSR
jgi:hypothetical protein